MEDADHPRDPPDDIVTAAFPNKNVRVVQRLNGRATNGVYELVTDRARIVLKTTNRAGWRLDKEAAILRKLAPVRGIPVPGVIDCGTVGDTSYLAIEFCEGTVAADVTNEGARALLRALGRLVAIVHNAVGFSQAGNPVADDGSIRVDGPGDWVGTLEELLDAEAQILRDTPFESAANRAKSLLADHTSTVEDPSTIRLLHTDLNPENVFVDSEGEVSCVIDWEYATAGDPVWDVTSAEQTWFYEGPFTSADRDALLEGYRAVRKLPAGYKRRRPLYLAFLSVGKMVGLAGGSEADQGDVNASSERIQQLHRQFECRIDAIADR